MTLAAPQVMPPNEWLRTFVPLGVSESETWSPLGAGVLFVDAPIVWFLTSRTALEAARGRQVLAWVEDAAGGTMVELTPGSREPFEWLTHAELDLAACLFPLDPSWRIKAFTEARCYPAEDLAPQLDVLVLSCAYGLGPLTSRPKPLVLQGALASVEEAQLVSTAALLPHNSGAPLLVSLPPQLGGGVALAGIATQTLAVPEPSDSVAPPVRLVLALPIRHAIGLVRSDEGKAQRKAAIASGK